MRSSMSGWVARSAGVRLYNCSDGAQIDAAVPKLASTVQVSGAPLDRRRLKERFVRETEAAGPDQPAGSLDFDRYHREAKRYFDALLAMVDQAIAEDADFMAFWKRLSEFMEKSENDYARVASVVSGSLLSTPKIGMFYVHRLARGSVRDEIFRFFMAEYRSLCEFMRDGTLDLLQGLAVKWPSIVEPAAKDLSQTGCREPCPIRT